MGQWGIDTSELLTKSLKRPCFVCEIFLYIIKRIIITFCKK